MPPGRLGRRADRAGDAHGCLRPRREGCKGEARPPGSTMTPPDPAAAFLVGPADRSQLAFSPYREFAREEWAKLRADTPMTLVPRDLEQLSGVIEYLSMGE